MAGLFLIEQLAQNVLQDLHPAKCSQSGSNLNSRALSMTAVELLSNALDEAERFLVAQKDLDCYSQVLEQQCAAMLRNCQMLPQLTGEQAAELINKAKDKLGKLANFTDSTCHQWQGRGIHRGQERPAAEANLEQFWCIRDAARRRHAGQPSCQQLHQT